MPAYLKRAFHPLIPIPFARIQLHQKPIGMRFGERKLRPAVTSYMHSRGLS
jgi:hypothetical protein